MIRCEVTGSVDEITQAHIDRAVADLVREFHGVCSSETVARLVEESVTALGATRITDFVPVLAYRFARERLRDLEAAGG